MREERVLLEEVADTAMLRRDIDPTGRVQEHRLVERDDTVIRSQQPRDDPEQRRLPGARRPDEGHRLAGLDRQVGRRAVAAKSVVEADVERHRVVSLTERSTSALVRMRSALIARATSKSRSNCS